MDLIDYIRLAFFVLIAVGLVILAINPRQKDEEDYEKRIDFLDKEIRESRARKGLPPNDQD